MSDGDDVLADSGLLIKHTCISSYQKTPSASSLYESLQLLCLPDENAGRLFLASASYVAGRGSQE